MTKQIKPILNVVTGSRADYDLLYWLMKEIEEKSNFEFRVVATGAHLSKNFGETYKAIELDGFKIDAKIPVHSDNDGPAEYAKNMATVIAGFADYFSRAQPNCLVLLGDRPEILSAAIAALPFRIVIAHIHGGEITRGALDDSIRHCLTKLSHLHFTSHEVYRDRVIQLGEDPANAFVVGALGVENVLRSSRIEKSTLERTLGFQFREKNFLVAFHPETLGVYTPEKQIELLVASLADFSDVGMIFTMPNSDPGNSHLRRVIEKFKAIDPMRIHIAETLGRSLYLSAMANVDVVVGNSSSGIFEAPALSKWTVNIGNRQDGRIKSSSVIDSALSVPAIQKCLKLALSLSSRSQAKSEFELGAFPSQLIQAILCEKFSSVCVQKTFYDVPVHSNRLTTRGRKNA